MLQLKRTLRLKGVASKDVLASALRIGDNELTALLKQGCDSAEIRETSRGYTLTPEGRENLAESLANERATINSVRLEAVYARFCALNGPFKQLISDWQLRTVNGENVPNDHSDAEYDSSIFAKLQQSHDAMSDVLAKAADLVPRLAVYRPRFDDALAEVLRGNIRMMAAPIVDSYHTLWFELHEEFIELCGRTRAQEAKAGRGT